MNEVRCEIVTVFAIEQIQRINNNYDYFRPVGSRTAVVIYLIHVLIN